jgi:phosphoribosylanthranilate isomerase
MVRVKICGITSIEDARAAVAAGADALGFVFAASPRRATPERAREIVAQLPPFVSTVGVFVDETPARIREIVAVCGLGYVQFHGSESPAVTNEFGPRTIKAVRVRTKDDLLGLERYRVGAFLLDAHAAGIAGGSGTTFPWELARRARLPAALILSGGLTPGNVAEAIRIVRPCAVDVSSGVESAPGKKDHELVREFIRRAKTAGTYADRLEPDQRQ